MVGVYLYRIISEHPAWKGLVRARITRRNAAAHLYQVHNGGEAQMVYMEFIDSKTGAKRKAQLEQVLLV